LTPLRQAGALAIVTEWKQFRSYDFDALRRQLQDKVIFDGRNMRRTGLKVVGWSLL